MADVQGSLVPAKAKRPSQPRKKKEPVLGPDGQPIPKPKRASKPRKKKEPGDGTAGTPERPAKRSKKAKDADSDDDRLEDVEEGLETVAVKNSGGDDDDDDEEAVLFNEEELQQENASMRDVINQFTPDQTNRYEFYRRIALPKAHVKKVVQGVTGSSCSQMVAIVMGGICKVFVGELVEESRKVMTEWGESGPVRPQHLREALRRLQAQGSAPSAPKPLFKR